MWKDTTVSSCGLFVSMVPPAGQGKNLCTQLVNLRAWIYKTMCTDGRNENLRALIS